MKDLNNTKNSRGPQIPQWRKMLYAPHAVTPTHKPLTKSKTAPVGSERQISTSDVLLYIAFLARCPQEISAAAHEALAKNTPKRKKKQ